MGPSVGRRHAFAPLVGALFNVGTNAVESKISRGAIRAGAPDEVAM